MTRQDCMVPCFKCGKELDRAFEYELQPSDGTAFETYGHYGSTFWDSFNGEQIAIIICDDCLREHTERIARHKRYRKVVVEYPPVGEHRLISHGVVGRQWVNHEPVPYFEGREDDQDDIVIEPEEVGKMKGVEWVQDWQDRRDSAIAAWLDHDKAET